jgi:hypothetical protein
MQTCLKNAFLSFLISFLPTAVWAGTIFNAEDAQIAAAVDQAEQTLPPKMRQVLQANLKGQTISVKISDQLGTDGAGLGNLKNKYILVGRKILNDPTQLQKTLVHEMSHIYDFLNVHEGLVGDRISYCTTWSDEVNERPTSDCALYSTTKSTVSTMPDFLELTGWSQIQMQKGQRQAQTFFTLRSPFKYEATNPYEMFAVNMELFLLDQEYKCRRPGLYNYLSKHFGYSPFAQSQCSGGLPFIDVGFEDPSKAIINIDPSRVYAIHYLLAEKGSEVMSSWGHSMYRIIMCAPERKTVGPECMKDVDHHIVLSFRASVLGVELSSALGLTGGYKSRLFFAPFLNVLNEYTKMEMRNLRSYEMNFSRAEIQSFLQRAIEIHWQYDGQYYFLTNNCAIESLNLLKTSTLRPELLNVQAQTPYQLLDQMLVNGVVSNDAFKDLKQAAVNDLYYPSLRDVYSTAISIINQNLHINVTVDQWLNSSATYRRDLVNKAGVTNNIRLYSSLTILERVISLRYTSQLFNTLLMAELKKNKASGKNLVDFKLDQNNMNGDFTNPGAWFSEGYGIPSSSEISSLKKFLNDLSAQKKSYKDQMDKYYQTLVSADSLKELDLIDDNEAFFRQSVKIAK